MRDHMHLFRRCAVTRTQSSGKEAKLDAVTSSSESTPSRLFWWDEIPTVLRFNRFIRSGYRAGLSKRACICSILQLHNETGNIHSHLVPGVLLVLLLLSGELPVWSKARWAFIGAVIPSLLCLCGSVCYHTMMPDHRHYKFYILIDVCGVFLVLVCGAGSGIQWGLQCYPLLCKALLTAYYSGAAACVLAGVRARTQLGRASPMLVLLGVRLGALVSRIVLRTGSQAAARHYAVMEAAGLLGAVLNVARVPERWLFGPKGPEPGCRRASFFDYWLNSHQLMHLLVLAAMLFKYLGSAEDYRYRILEQSRCED